MVILLLNVLQIKIINMESLLITALVSFISFIVGIYIAKHIFRIDEIVKLQHKQTRLIAKMCKYNNVPENEIEEVLDIAIQSSDKIPVGKYNYNDIGPLTPNNIKK